MKLSYLLALGMFAASPVLTATSVDARPSQWRTLATQTIKSGTARDTIGVRSRDRFRQIQLCARNASLRLNTYSIRFDNGRLQNVRVNARINSGACTRAINLTSAPRRIDRVSLAYQSIPRGSRSPQIRVVAR